VINRNNWNRRLTYSTKYAAQLNKSRQIWRSYINCSTMFILVLVSVVVIIQKKPISMTLVQFIKKLSTYQTPTWLNIITYTIPQKCSYWNKCSPETKHKNYFNVLGKYTFDKVHNTCCILTHLTMFVIALPYKPPDHNFGHVYCYNNCEKLVQVSEHSQMLEILQYQMAIWILKKNN